MSHPHFFVDYIVASQYWIFIQFFVSVFLLLVPPIGPPDAVLKNAVGVFLCHNCTFRTGYLLLRDDENSVNSGMYVNG